MDGPQQLHDRLLAQNYIADSELLLSLFLALKLDKPLLVEGPPGVGKTAIASALAPALDRPLIRLQCYEGLDEAHALYEWNYARQLLTIRLNDGAERSRDAIESDIFSESFLLKRPLLKAITCDVAPVLLIDELDRADEEFESFLLEILADWQVTIPEIGTIHATHIPQVIITSNRVRDLSDAIRRRCFYVWINYPDLDKELTIVHTKFPDVDLNFARSLCQFMQTLRHEQLDKTPGTAETCDWVAALCAMHCDALEPSIIADTLGVIIKDCDDLAHLDGQRIAALLTESQSVR